MQGHKQFPWFIHSLATNLSTACPAGCKHCLWQARQKRMALQHGVMNRSEMLALAEVARSFGIKEIVASGGEPFSRPEALAALSTICASNALGLHAITSAVWADTPMIAENMLKKNGPWSRLAVSIDNFHQESIPLQNCVHVLNAAVKLGIPITIASVEGADDVVQDIPESIKENIPVVSQPLMGMRRMPWKELDGPCINMSVPYCEDGDMVYGCCGDLCEMGEKSPVYFGKTDTLALKGIADDRITLIKYLRLFGPRSLYTALTDENPSGSSPYASQCELCTAIFSLPDSTGRVTAFLNSERTLARIALAEAVLFSNTRPDINSFMYSSS